ncbi:DUF3450 family protein [Pelagicoccus sp. SDUM812002]|uniref:DUF3450 family protein n=1 Tax=Pelagicoccus sp. SDUM812002 TaxID=3041266 RepID=UPI00280D84F1|nr:DUF3450 family protein [Pelagicoccus sp. SDUM812002]MDQ8186346.1 DUF3450 family protein [Pelagicoccus sp. SDUM812002]
MIPRPAFLLLALPLCSLTQTPTIANELDSLKDLTDRWIQTRNRISKEKSQWVIEKELLEGSVDTLSSTQEILSENVEILEMQSREATDAISEAEAKVAQFEETNTTVLAQVSVYEDRIRRLAERLPPPLLDEIAPLLRKIPDQESSSTPVPNRLQNVVAISTLIDEFNNDLTLAHTIKELDDGSIIEVRVLYWGLAGAYASNLDGTKAWVISPTTSSWKWTPAGTNSLAIKSLFDVYDKTIDPALVGVPFSFLDEGGEK